MSESADDLWAAAGTPPEQQSEADAVFAAAAPRPSAAPDTRAQYSAFQASSIGVTPDVATTALPLARQTGFDPTFTAQNFDMVKNAEEQRAMAAHLAQAPAMAAYTDQSAAHAASMSDSYREMSTLEWLITGRFEKIPGSGFDSGYRSFASGRGGASPFPQGHYVPPAPFTALVQGLKDVEHIYYTGKKLLGFGSPEDEAEIQTLQREQAVDVAPSGLGGKMLVGGLRAAPNLAFAALGARFGGPGGLAATFYAQGVGPLYQRIREEHPDIADEDAKVFAATGAGIGASIAEIPGLGFVKNLPGVKSIIARVGEEAVAKTLTQAGVKFAVQGGKHALLGAATVAAQGAVNQATIELSGAPQDWSDASRALDRVGAATARSFQSGLVDMGALALLTPGRELLSDIGRAQNARTERARLTAMETVARVAKLAQRAPAEAEQALAGAAAQPGADATVYIDHEALSKNPEALAAVTQAVGQAAVDEAAATRGDVAVPIEKYLTQLVAEGHAEKLAGDVKLSADGWTQRQADEWAEAWHGTPHTVAKFDMSKIGTGQGAATYGHGIYLAEAKETAEFYRTALSEEPAITSKAGPIPAPLLDQMKAIAHGAQSRDPADVIKRTRAVVENIIASTERAREIRLTEPPQGEQLTVEQYDDRLFEMRARLEALDKLKPEHLQVVTSGNLYRVAIPPKDALLDHDKSIADQSPQVMKKLEAAGLIAKTPGETGMDLHYPATGARSRLEDDAAVRKYTGQSLYRDLGGSEAASNILRKAGISGLKYLDAGSREGEAQTHNFVIWDESKMRILTDDEPLPGTKTEPQLPPAKVLRQYADSMAAKKAIGDLQPGTYRQAERRAMDQAVKAAGAEDKAGETILRKYAEALQVSQESVTEAVAAARTGFYGAGMEKLTEGATGKLALREAGRRIRGVEKAGEKLESGRLETLRKLEEEHAALEEERANTVRNFRNAATMNQHLEKAVAALRKKADAEVGYLQSSASTDAAAKDLARAPKAYQEAANSILSAVALGGEATPGAIDTLLTRLKADLAQPKFNVDAIRALIAKPLEIHRLTLGEVQNVANAIRQIRYVARRSTEVSIGGIGGGGEVPPPPAGGGAGAGQPPEPPREPLQAVVDRLRDESKDLPDQPKIPSDLATVGTLRRLDDVVSGGQAALRAPERLWAKFGKTGQAIFEGYVNRRNYRDSLDALVTKYYAEHWDEKMPDEVKARRYEILDLSALPMPENMDATRSRTWLMKLMLHMGNAGNRMRTLEGYGWSFDQVMAEAGKHLNAHELAFIQSIWDFNEKNLKPLIWEQERRMEGAEPTAVDAMPFTVTLADGSKVEMQGGYFPLKRDLRPGVQPEPSPAGPGRYLTPDYQIASTSHSYTEDRAERAKYIVNLQWNDVPGHIQQVIHDLAFREYTMDVARLLDDPGFQQIAVQKQGTAAYNALKSDLYVMANGRAEYTAQNMNKLVGAVRSRVATASVVGSIPVLMGQFLHPIIAIAAGEIPVMAGTRAFVQGFSPSVREEARMVFPEVQHRYQTNQANFRQMLGNIGPRGNVGPVGRFTEQVRVIAHGMQQAVDDIVTTQIALASHSEARAGGLSGEEAVVKAGQTVRRLMPTHDIAEQSALLRDRGVIGSLLMFHGFMNKLYNIAADRGGAAQAAYRQGDWAGVARNTGQILGMLAVAGLGRYIMGHGAKQDEDPAEFAEKEALLMPSELLPFGREIMQPFVESMLTDKTLSASLKNFDIRFPALGYYIQQAKNVGTLVDENAENEDRVTAAIELALAGLKLPRQPLRTGKYLYDVATDREQPQGPFDFGAGLAYGTRPNQPGNPGRDLQAALR